MKGQLGTEVTGVKLSEVLLDVLDCGHPTWFAPNTYNIQLDVPVYPDQITILGGYKVDFEANLQSWLSFLVVLVDK